ncbi:MAG: hypothetical protein FWF76_01745 [Oscillospiraceae bacterium]|nr:hypothetical protein [Oscillospiraceae bacterium]
MIPEFTFPFNEVPSGSRVVIWGAGACGKSYYGQLCGTDYAKVILWVDVNTRSSFVVAPEEIKSLRSDDYEFVVIAVQSSEVAKDISDLLKGEYGVAESKIVHKPSLFMSNLSLQDFLCDDREGIETVKKAILDFFYVDVFYTFYFDVLYKEIKASPESKTLVINQIKKFIKRDDFTLEMKILIMYVGFETRIFSDELLREFVRLVSQVSNNSPVKYWLLFDLTCCWSWCFAVYDGFFAELKSLREDYAKSLNLSWNPPDYVNKNNQNICVIMNWIKPFDGNPFPNLFSPIFKLLGKKYNIHIIDVAPNYPDRGGGFLEKPKSKIVELTLTSEEKHKYYPDMEVYQIQNATMKDRQQNVLDVICEINPLCILDLSDEFSNVSYYYYQNFPTIYYAGRAMGKASSTFFHKYIVSSADEIKVEPPILPEQVIKLPLFFECITPLRKFERSEYGITSEDVVVVTVGSRLEDEISNELQEQMCGFLRSDNKVKWLIVGCNSLDFMSKNHSDLIGENIKFIEYEKDLAGLYSVCDIYLNPERIGGGTSVALALHHELIVVCTKSSTDGASWIKWSDCVALESELVAQIKNYSIPTNRELLARRKKEMGNNFKKSCNPDEFIEKLSLAIENLSNEFA